jgi:hypothetical protein
MSDHLPNVGDSAEHIAFRLLETILEKDPPTPPSTSWILSTYARCLRMVRNPEVPPRPQAAGPRPRI